MPSLDQASAATYIALGSNIGDREEHLRSAIAALNQIGDVTAVSSFYETEPVGTISQPDFLNAAVELRTQQKPEELLASLLRIEQQHGRHRTVAPPKGPRTLDLDLLSYDNIVLQTPTLTLPHPALEQRRFVLAPLAEIAPQWQHPVSSRTATQMLADLADKCRDELPAVRRITTPQQSP
jgi:2-amino-4-hydroxy-6-hydroxymethyldihydropteridine diphosphokinase